MAGNARLVELAKGNKGPLAAVIGTAAAALLVPLVAQWEGKRTDPYKDIVGVWTVCYGETRVAMRRYSDVECTAMLERGLVDFAKPVLARNPELAGHPNQLAAAVSLAYNIGPANYNRSMVAKRFSSKDWKGGCEAFLSWRFAGGREVAGLVKRRKAEMAICKGGL
jgi:lysozyme